mmetsp:Transcript_36341/g.83817  ORF Transcript_36341/g.83817 Transcript_36341/m.83817 type:complete len:96 (-) Transcript_36341:1043-1330(-)
MTVVLICLSGDPCRKLPGRVRCRSIGEEEHALLAPLAWLGWLGAATLEFLVNSNRLCRLVEDKGDGEISPPSTGVLNGESVLTTEPRSLIRGDAT